MSTKTRCFPTILDNSIWNAVLLFPLVLVRFSLVTFTMKLRTRPESCPYRYLRFHATLVTCSFRCLLCVRYVPGTGQDLANSFPRGTRGAWRQTNRQCEHPSPGCLCPQDLRPWARNLEVPLCDSNLVFHHLLPFLTPEVSARPLFKILITTLSPLYSLVLSASLRLSHPAWDPKQRSRCH